MESNRIASLAKARGYRVVQRIRSYVLEPGLGGEIIPCIGIRLRPFPVMSSPYVTDAASRTVYRPGFPRALQYLREALL
jgi:hypothetical protein